MNREDADLQVKEMKERRMSSRLRFKDDEPMKHRLKISFSNHDIICPDSESICDGEEKEQQQEQSHQLPFIRIETSSNEDEFHTDDDECQSLSDTDTSRSHSLSLPPVSLMVRRGSVDNLIQHKYKCDYFLKDDQYTLLKEYFDMYASDELIDRNLFETHLIKYALCANRKETIHARDTDIKNALDVIDSDSNYFIDFNEFLDFLTLFFANKTTLKRKIISVLNGHQYSHSQAGYLTLDEANTHVTFLANFYQAPNPSGIEFDSELISYDQFADHIYSNLENYLFVKQN